jgi:hypothetical protein
MKHPLNTEVEVEAEVWFVRRFDHLTNRTVYPWIRTWSFRHPCGLPLGEGVHIRTQPGESLPVPGERIVLVFRYHESAHPAFDIQIHNGDEHYGAHRWTLVRWESIYRHEDLYGSGSDDYEYLEFVA